jgi:hypothetical protein
MHKKIQREKGMSMKRNKNAIEKCVQALSKMPPSHTPDRGREMIVQHLVKKGYTGPFTEEQIEKWRQFLLFKCRAPKTIKDNSQYTHYQIPQPSQQKNLTFVLPPCAKIPQTNRLLVVPAGMQPSSNNRTFVLPARDPTKDNFKSAPNFPSNLQIHGFQVHADVLILVFRALVLLLKIALKSLRRIAGRRLDYGAQWLPISLLDNNNPKQVLQSVAMRDCDLAEKQSAIKTTASKKPNAEAEVNRKRANQMLQDLDTCEDTCSKRLKPLKNDIFNERWHNTRYIDDKLCDEDILHWLANNQCFWNSTILAKKYLYVGAPTIQTDSKKVIHKSLGQKRIKRKQ